MKKFLALLLAAVMCLGLLAGCGPKETGESNPPADNSTAPSEAPSESQEVFENKVILGDVTELSGDFRYPGWGSSSVGASDQGVWFLTSGLSTMESDQGGDYQWSQTVVKSHEETENDDSTCTYTIEIYDDLKFSDGSPVTAKNYLAYVLSFSTPVAQGTNHSGMNGQALVGFEDFNAYTGPGSETGTKEFSGVRLLGDYTFSLTVSSDYYPSYFAYTNGAVQPYVLEQWLGKDVDIMDDGNGCYLTDNYYEMNGEDYVKAAEILGNRYNLDIPYSGPYVVSEWDEGTSQAVMTINPEYKGNFEGQKPSIETIVYSKIIEETQVAQLTGGEIDVLGQVTGGDATKAALAVVDGEKFVETHYQRAGYGKIQFDCDFGPTMFKEVRQAVAYLLNRNEFCQTFTGGYGVVVDGPYSPDFSMWQAVQDEIELTDYSFSPDTAVKVLEEGGWIYNSKGEPYEPGQTGVDAVRYKKLTAEEANAASGDGTADVNKNYASVANTDGVTYKTVEVNGEYYMPLAINWFGSQPNSVTDLLTTTLSNSSDLAAAGMVIRSTTGDFTLLQGNIYREASYGYEGTPTYGMYNLATGWPSAVYDQSYNWSLDPKYFPYSSNKVLDEYDKAFPYDQKAEKLSYEEAVEASGDKLGMDYLSMAMIFNATTEDEYNHWWMGYIERWNELMPDIPLYSNYYYDVYNAKIENFETSPFFDQDRAILYANVKGF